MEKNTAVSKITKPIILDFDCLFLAIPLYSLSKGNNILVLDDKIMRKKLKKRFDENLL